MMATCVQSTQDIRNESLDNRGSICEPCLHGVVSLLDMRRFYSDLFVKSLWEISQMEGKWVHGRLDAPVPFPAGVGGRVCAIQLDLIEHGLPNSAAQCDRIMEACDGHSAITFREAIALMKGLRERVEDELRTKVFLSLDLDEAKLYLSPTQGWDEITSRFKESIRDVEEMSKCFALERYAACVFHSMQVIEHGLIHLGKWLNVGDRKVGWNATTRELDRIVKTKPPERTDWENKHFAFIEQMNGTCYALMTAWRHKIDHASGRLILLPGDFAPEIARDIISATRAFMLRLAIELPNDARPENG